MKNYHYYLKQEIPPRSSDGARFNAVQWHPEDPLKLYIAGNGMPRLETTLMLRLRRNSYLGMGSFLVKTAHANRHCVCRRRGR